MKVFAAKVAYLGVAGVVVVAALWASGLPPAQWLARLRKQDPVSEVSQLPDQHAISSSGPESSVSATRNDPYSLPGTDASASSSPLPLYLVGVVPGRNVTEGSAHIGTSIENPQTYSAGATLSNGARLAEIHPDHVVLTKGARSVRLDLYQRNDPARQLTSRDELLMVGGAPAEPVVTQPRSREVLTDYLRPTPVYDGDVMRGYQLYPGKKAGLFAQMGLQAGDIITAIDGMPLTEPEHAIQMLRELTAGAALHVTIERGGRREQATLDGAAILADRERVQTVRRSASTEQPSI